MVRDQKFTGVKFVILLVELRYDRRNMVSHYGSWVPRDIYASEYSAVVIKEDSRSESHSVIERIVVQNLPHMETWLT
jgi:hypothetical protein